MAAHSKFGAACLVDAAERDTAADKAVTGILLKNKAVSAVANQFKCEAIF